MKRRLSSKAAAVLARHGLLKKSINEYTEAEAVAPSVEVEQLKLSSKAADALARHGLLKKPINEYTEAEAVAPSVEVEQLKLSSKAADALARHGLLKKPINEPLGIAEHRVEENHFSTEAVAVEPLAPLPGAEENQPDIAGSASNNRFYNGYELTDEQDQAVDLAEMGDDLKIEAYAGAGKTSTLAAISDALKDKRGLYIAFNKTIATEAAQKFPNNVECRTAHSLAYRAVGYKFKNRFGRLAGGYVAEEVLNLSSVINDLTPACMGNMVIDVINRFTQSADLEIGRDHAPWSYLALTVDDKDLRYAIADDAIGYARKLWKMMIDPEKKVPITHDTYLKLWSMDNPKINKDFILFDEAQDASPVMLNLVCDQQAQNIFVGDRYQQIYSWRGAVNAMQKIVTTNSCQISQSFRFGQPIADVANAILNNNLGANVNIRGFDEVSSSVVSVKSPDAILCRTNGTLINALINRLKSGDKIAVAGGCSDTISLLKAAGELKESGFTSYRELSLFKSWEEVVEFSETDAGSDLATLVRLVTFHDLNDLISALERTNRVKDRDADLILSTAHKSKGMEWGSVRLENDFRHVDSKGYSSEESNLLYVAATRAINQLDVGDCDAVQKSTEKPTGGRLCVISPVNKPSLF